jgi:hypothetical protein
MMQAHGLTLLAGTDADFDRVPGITRYRPAWLNSDQSRPPGPALAGTRFSRRAAAPARLITWFTDPAPSRIAAPPQACRGSPAPVFRF